MAYVEVFCLLIFSSFIFHLIKRPRIGLNEPPLLPYRYPIIGHTYRLLYDSENFLKKCKEKYGEPFSLYVFGSVRTFTGVDSTPEILRNSDVFDLNTGSNKTFPVADVFKKFTYFTPSYLAQVVHEHVSVAKPIANVLLGEEVFVSITTTSRTLSFAVFDYAGRPELWNELYEELLKIYNESNDYLSTEDVNTKMVKLDCFLKESFRYSSDIAILPHTVVGDSYTFGNGTTIPKDRDVYLT
ncbi:cytochrome P450 [Gigaspora margarita]|uniref:Cytochrome P450 n=1 Tax=Gigaspora margarita TaxID=4874 RepID=A0A8H4AEN1_GIGMA|nr:cytochrome P450 [Gigaspora margarita]